MGDNFFDELFKEPNPAYVPPPIDFHQLFATTPPHQQQRMLILIQQFQAKIITLKQFQEQTHILQQERIMQQHQMQQQQQQQQIGMGLRDRPVPQQQQPSQDNNRIQEMLRKRQQPEPIHTQQKRMRADDNSSAVSPGPATGRTGIFELISDSVTRSDQLKSSKPRPNTPQETDMDLGQMMDVTNYAGVDLRVLFINLGRRIRIG